MNMAAATLECRLLSACNCAYAIDDQGVFTAPAPYFDAAGFTAVPAAIVGGQDNINAALVGANSDGIIIAFRGTLPPDVRNLPSLLDWAQDFEAGLTAITSIEGIPGKVHSGFWRGLDTIWDGVLAAVKAAQAAGGGSQRVYVTGHSKGGGFAHLAAMRLQAAEQITPTEVCTFASPRVGDADFATLYDQAISAFRYEYQDDIVPHLPLDITVATALKHSSFLSNQLESLPVFDYADVGTLRFIDRNNQIVGDSDQVKAERLASLALLIIRQKIDTIVSDHRAGCGGGYMTQVCPGTCPVLQ
jgi:hypothetical protein